jgi:Na+-transporting NADH:ubiquinone oxidoreductase subunit C
MRERIYTVVFMILLGLVAAVVLTAANHFLKPMYDANKEREAKGNVLIALGIEGWDKARVARAKIGDIKDAFHNHIITVYQGRELGPDEELPPGAEADFYVGYNTTGGGVRTPIGYAFKITGPGFWDRISGYLAVDAAVEKVIGITFYEDNETPGLGHKINDADWQEQWMGRSIYRPGTDEPWIGIVPPGTELKDDQVHAISGATETSGALQKFMNAQLKAFVAAVKAYKSKNEGAPAAGGAS